ncbi:hypothetical protein LZ906_017505 (plasmid) [Paraclostridium ghonii]|nr:hypothetical protein [Paeniclostridium ghonii]MCM0166545.1 hypothetical protein [Paeniclostridium ghonii]
MYKNLEEHLNDSDRFGTCEECENLTCNSKLEEFEGICEECYYKDK